MSLRLYTILSYLLLPIILWRTYKRCRALKSINLPAQLTDYFACSNTFQPQKQGIWIHVLSLGEARSAKDFIETLARNHPHLPITLTYTTLSAAEYIHNRFPNISKHVMPFDQPSVMQRFIHQLQPKLILMVETEIWPNLLHQASTSSIPVMLINARLKRKSTLRYQKYAKKLVQQSLQKFTLIFPQSELDAKHFYKLGAKPEQISLIGNLKFDLQPSTNLVTKAQQWRTDFAPQRPIWVAASTHEHEGEKILVAHSKILQSHPECLLIIAPRHDKTNKETNTALIQHKFRYNKRSKNALSEIGLNEPQVLLIDQIGELMFWYAVSDYAFVGGSLVPFGGHNIIEPALLKKPVLSGPNYANLENLFEPAIKYNAVNIVKDEMALATQICTLIEQPEQAHERAETAYQFALKNQGIREKIQKILAPYLAEA